MDTLLSYYTRRSWNIYGGGGREGVASNDAKKLPSNCSRVDVEFSILIRGKS